MDSFPSDFNLESLQKEPSQFDNTNPSIKEQRKRIYTHTLQMVAQMSKDAIFDMPFEMTQEDRKQLARELCASFPGRVDHLVVIESEKEEFVPIEDGLNPPSSSEYRIRIRV